MNDVSTASISHVPNWGSWHNFISKKGCKTLQQPIFFTPSATLNLTIVSNKAEF